MEIEYPAIKLFRGDPRIYAYAGAGEFHLASADLIGIYVDAVFIDAGGTEYRIQSAHRVGWGTWLMGYHPLLKGRMAKIDFTPAGTRDLPLHEFRDMVASRLRLPGIGSDWYPSGIQKILPRVEKASSFEEIISLFLYDIGEEA